MTAVSAIGKGYEISGKSRIHASGNSTMSLKPRNMAGAIPIS